MRMHGHIAVAILGIALLLIVAMIPIGIAYDNHKTEQCENRGGHIGPKRLCLTPDGRVLEP